MTKRRRVAALGVGAIFLVSFAWLGKEYIDAMTPHKPGAFDRYTLGQKIRYVWALYLEPPVPLAYGVFIVAALAFLIRRRWIRYRSRTEERLQARTDDGTVSTP